MSLTFLLDGDQLLRLLAEDVADDGALVLALGRKPEVLLVAAGVLRAWVPLHSRLPGAVVSERPVHRVRVRELATVREQDDVERLVVWRPDGDVRRAGDPCAGRLEDVEGPLALAARLHDLARLDPRWLFLVGIAGAFPAEEFTLGDVLLASRVHDFAITAALEGQPDELAGKGGPVHRLVAELLEVLPSAAGGRRLGQWNGPAAIPMPKPKQKVPASVDAPAFYGEEKWRKRVQKGLKANFPVGKEPRLPRYRTEGVVTANVLAKDTALVQRWKEVARTAAHVEMELGGVYEAAHRADKPVLSVRG